MVSKGFVGLGSLPGKAMGALGKVKGFFSGLFGGGKDNFGVTASVSRWAPIAAQALALAGAPISWLPSLMKRMQRESGGNPSAINNWDINAKHGDPSRGLMQCVTLDTRILTDRGWLTYDQVQVGDRTIGYNSATGRSEWTTITRVVTYDDAPVWRVGHKRWHADVTPNHRWWSDTRTASGKTRGEFVRTEDFNTMHRIRLAAPADTDGIPGLSLDDVAVLAWLQGDGTYREAKDRPGHYDGAIFQSKPGMVVKIRALLARVPHTESIRAPRTRRTMPQHVFRLRRAYVTDLIKRSEVEDTGPEAFVLRLSPDQRALWLAAMIDAEGHRMPGKRPGHSEFVRIAQAVGPMQDAIRLAVYLEGWRPTYSENSARRNGYQPAGVVGMAKPHVAPVTFHDPVDLPRQTVWCVKTGLETWTAELDGQVFLTGNTIGATFNAYAGSLRGRGIYDPLANIYAAVRYTIARYGSGPAGWDRAGGYDSGGLLMPGSTLAVNATGRPERILNAEHTARLDALLASGGSGRMHPDDIRALAAAMSNLAVLLDGQQVGKVVDARLNAVGRSAAYRRSER
jgi:SLT domain-containing protein